MRSVFVISKDIVSASIVERNLKEEHDVTLFATIQSSLEHLYNTIPDLLVIDITDNEPRTVDLLNKLKGDPLFNQFPVLAIVKDDLSTCDWNRLAVEDYIRESCIEAELKTRASLCLARAERVVEVSPLTKLPGNIAITKQIQARIDSGNPFALAYTDIDYFKPFNDRYGFSRGDEIIKMVGRLILNAVKDKEPDTSFVGHIGGDDFVFIIGYDLAEEASQTVINYFDRLVPTFYDPEDRARGYVESVDREGNRKTYPIMSLSIGVAHNRFRKFTHYGQVAEIASEMKKFAKRTPASCFRIDRRKR